MGDVTQDEGQAARHAPAISMTGGLASPVFDAQTVFRAVMDALARPGSIQPVTVACAPPPPLTPVAGAIACTLLDHDTPVWLDKASRLSPAVGPWLAFQTSAPLAVHAADADFALVADAPGMPVLDGFAQGTQEYPDRSTTLIIQVAGLARGEKWRLTGPGIETEAFIAPRGLPPHFLTQWSANRARFPRGVDVILAAAEGIVGLPRTVTIEKRED